jgi:hypothetical protein
MRLKSVLTMKSDLESVNENLEFDDNESDDELQICPENIR